MTHRLHSWPLLALSLLLSFSSLCAQVADNDVEGEVFFLETAEEKSPFEIPNAKVMSADVEAEYTKLLSKLYERQTSLQSSLKAFESKKAAELAKTSSKDLELLKVTTRDIKFIQEDLEKLNKDLTTLKKSATESKSSKPVLKNMKEISGFWFPVENDEKEVIENWEDEFDYIKAPTVKQLEMNALDCGIAFNGIDPGTLQKKLQTTPENVISYTHPKLEEFYKENAFLTADLSLVEMGKDKFMIVEIVIRSRDAIKNYGMIQAGAPMKIELINGESSYFFAQANAMGTLVPQTTSIKYEVLYFIEKSEYKLIKKSEIDNIGLMWSSGYEKYDVYNVDVLKNQIDCLEKF